MKPGRGVEFAADNFAWDVIRDRHGFWYEVGALATFALLWLIEAIEQHEDSTSHPSAPMRLGNLLKLMPDDQREQMGGIVIAMLVLCESAIQKLYGIRFQVM